MKSGKPPDTPVFFVDRSLGGRIVPEALLSAGVEVIAHDQRFSPDTSDEEWLAVAGAEGWIVLTRDRRIRYRPNEKAALQKSGALVFVMTASALTGQAAADLLVRALDDMTEIAQTSDRPAIYAINSRGQPQRMVF